MRIYEPNGWCKDWLDLNKNGVHVQNWCNRETSWNCCWKLVQANVRWCHRKTVWISNLDGAGRHSNVDNYAKMSMFKMELSGTTLFPQLRMFSKCFKLNRTFYCQLKLNKLKHIPHINIKILLKNSFQNMLFVNLTEEQCDLLTSLWCPFTIITPNQTNFNKHGLVEYYFWIVFKKFPTFWLLKEKKILKWQQYGSLDLNMLKF